MTLTEARRVADAVLHEGYLLYPYRADSAKNQLRWQHGVLGPRGAFEAGAGEPVSACAEVLVTSGGTVDVLVRFLQVQCREVETATGGGWRPTDQLVTAGARWVPFHEAVPHELTVTGVDVGADRREVLTVPGGESVEELRDGDEVVGRLVRTRWPLTLLLEVGARPAEADGLTRLRLSLTNTGTLTSPAAQGEFSARDVAARHSAVAAHLLLTARGTSFVSLLAPPAWAERDAACCRQDRWWPGLVADDAGGDALLVAPIVLGDHPRIAPESCWDLGDATEVDELLVLRVLTLTDEEKSAARGTDPFASRVLDQVERLSTDALARLHGARREAALVPGVRVRLTPRRGADAQDMFLQGRTAVVARVDVDLDGGTHVGVTLDDDPGADLRGGTGRLFWFGRDEVEAVDHP